MKVERFETGVGLTLRVSSDDRLRAPKRSVFVGGSGTTARLLISFAALCPKVGSTARIIGDDSLSRRPMRSLLDSLGQLGVECSSEGDEGCLPVLVKGGGIPGGECAVEGSISSQFVSSLLISCVRADRGSLVRIRNPSRLVSEHYVDCTLHVLRHFGFQVEARMTSTGKYAGFEIPGNQHRKSRNFLVPGDMSSAASLVGAAIAAGGTITLHGANMDLPQPDSEFVSNVIRRFGARVTLNKRRRTLFASRPISCRTSDPYEKTLEFDMGKSPDIVPVVAAIAVALGRPVKVRNVPHLRYKESDRLRVLSRELRKLAGVVTREGKASLSVQPTRDPVVDATAATGKPIFLDSYGDHRMLMALTIIGLSGGFGDIFVSDPLCVKKSYPEFVDDLRALCHSGECLEVVTLAGATDPQSK